MNQARTYPSGVPCWVDTLQPDPDAAGRFYGELFGWTLQDGTAALHGQPAAGIGSGSSAAWNTYVCVDDVDAVARSVAAADGSVVAQPADVDRAGRAASCADPEGATFRLWQPRDRPGAHVVNVPGAWNFSVLHTAEPDAVLPFYASVFGWAVDDQLGAGTIRVPGYGDHLAATSDPHIHERQAFAPPGFADVVAGVVEDADAAHAGWRVTFTVADRDATAMTAERLGATVISSTDTAWTREAVVRDPQGAVLTVSQFAPPGRQA